MAKKKAPSKHDLLSAYIDFVLTHNENPKSVYGFTKMNNTDESEFYKYFASFQAIESAVFTSFFENSMTVLEQTEQYQTFDARNKLLAFYFTFFEILSVNRSFVLYVLKKYDNSLKFAPALKGLKLVFIQYVASLGIQMIDIKQAQLERMQQRTLKESAWIQLLITMKFWKEDHSNAFEKTDIFIEKSVNTTFDILNVAPLESMMDLGKFLFKETFSMN
ncbi:TetR family transcriptional regulator C-terminal domain-containing protein [Allotamlana fucoidanivorans]|uniref:TetR/AcrR family transcriptional regulator n=1 Tax=Allotamlana fucoidanivorans TaxID=2583814 RepID=A0A5C4SGJ9_9FLAO|nr:TetR family transcriptional regulator C-terminal domain-containing protein [Tamlana fucoidanivorans]TNJ42448.1 TetR/AcrR family transcriptional regulator [Tamlana fucoidanivorans]